MDSTSDGSTDHNGVLPELGFHLGKMSQNVDTHTGTNKLMSCPGESHTAITAMAEATVVGRWSPCNQSNEQDTRDMESVGHVTYHRKVWGLVVQQQRDPE
jgi:hypothetical protein